MLNVTFIRWGVNIKEELQLKISCSGVPDLSTYNDIQ